MVPILDLVGVFKVLIEQLTYILLQGMTTGCEWALVAVGFGFIARTTNIFHVAIGGSFTVGSYIYHFCNVELGLSLGSSASCSLMAAGLLGVIINQCVYQPVTGLYGQRRVSKLMPLIAALGTLIVIQNGIQLLFGASPLAVQLDDLGVTTIGDARISYWNLVRVLISGLGICIFAAWLGLTRAGSSAIALGQSAEGASVVGISERSVRVQVFFATGLLAGLAGVLAIITHPVLPHDSMPIVLNGALIAMVLPNAGILAWWGLSISAAIIYAASVTFVGGGWPDVILKSSLVVAIILTQVVIPTMRRLLIIQHTRVVGKPASTSHSSAR